MLQTKLFHVENWGGIGHPGLPVATPLATAIQVNILDWLWKCALRFWKGLKLNIKSNINKTTIMLVRRQRGSRSVQKLTRRCSN